jgi:hypothetical protein
VSLDPVGNKFASLDVRTLNINGTDTELFVAQMGFVVRRHVMLNEKAVTFDLANQVRFVTPRIEIAVSYLAIIVGTDRVIALANVDHQVHVVRQALNRHVDDVHRCADFVFAGGGKVRFIDLNMFASSRHQSFEVLM